MLDLKGLTKKFQGKAEPAVDGLTLHVNRGEIFGFLGPNGAGKSTTIKMITGVLAPTEGSVTIGGTDVVRDPVTAKKKIGYVSDNHATYERLTGNEYLSFIARVYGVNPETCREEVSRYAEMFGLTDALDAQISAYSHGMKQKIAVMAAVIHNPELWILDEPLTGLDPQSAFDLKHIMREYASQGNTVFFSSHVIDVVEKLCDRVGIIANGRLIKVASVAELKEEFPGRSLESVFLDITGSGRI